MTDAPNGDFDPGRESLEGGGREQLLEPAEVLVHHQKRTSHGAPFTRRRGWRIRNDFGVIKMILWRGPRGSKPISGEEIAEIKK